MRGHKPNYLRPVSIAVWLTSFALVGFAFVPILLSGNKAEAAVPSYINYQSRLRNYPSLTPVTGATNVQFSIYNHATNGVPGDSATDHYTAGTTGLLWKETHTVTPDAQGYFHVALGSDTPFPSYLTFTKDPLYLGVKVDTNDEATPRAQIGAAPYSFSVGTFSTDGADGLRGEKTGVATVGTPGYDSSQLLLQGSGWTGAAAADREIKLQNTVTDASAYRFSILNNSDAELLSVNQDGLISITGGQGIDTLAAGDIALGVTNATSVTICSTANCDTINLGTNTDADTINIGDSSATDIINLYAADDSIINLAAINLSDGSEGLILPQNASACAAATAEGQICWDTAGEDLYVGNGSAAVQINGAGGTGDIEAVGDITSGEAFTSGTPGTTLTFVDSGATLDVVGAAATTLTIANSGAGSGVSVSLAEAGSYTGSGAVTLSSGTASTLTIDSGTTGAINFGTSANAKTITIGNTTTTTGLVLNSGTGSIALASTSTGDITLNSSDTVLIDSAGVLELNSSGGVISIGNDAVAQAINIGTGAAARTITVGNTTTTTGVTLQSGSNGINLNPSINQPVNINTGTSTGTVTIGGTGALTIAIGTGATSGKTIQIGTGAVNNTITIGSSSAQNVSITDNNWSVSTAGAAVFVGVNSGSGLIQGTGGLTVTGTTQINATTTGTTTIGNSSGGAVSINSGANDITLTSADDITINGGGASAAINIGTVATAHTVTVGNTTGVTALNFTTGTGAQTHTSNVTTGTGTGSAFVFDATAITSGTGLHLVSDSVTSGQLLNVTTSGNTWQGNSTSSGLVSISSSSTAGSSQANTLYISRTGAQSGSTTSVGLDINVLTTGTNTTNIGQNISIDGAGTAGGNIGLQIDMGNNGVALGGSLNAGLVVDMNTTTPNPATQYGGYFNVINVGATTNTALYANAIGATTNYGLIVANGLTGLNTPAPTAYLEVGGLVAMPVSSSSDGDDAIDMLIGNGVGGGGTNWADNSSVGGRGGGGSLTLGDGGPNTSVNTTTNISRGGVGGEFSVTGGAGGTHSGSLTLGAMVIASINGGVGGALSFATGSGGDSTGTVSASQGKADGIGGLGGAFTLATGVGGDATGALAASGTGLAWNTGGSGGSLQLNTGAGGNANGADGSNERAVGGVGGTLTIFSGNGGDGTASGGNSGAVGGSGGSVAIYAGTGGSATGGLSNINGSGGSVSIYGGLAGPAGTGGTDGAVYLGGNLTSPISKVFVNLVQSTGTKAVCNATGGTTGMLELSDCSGTPAADYMEIYPTAEDVETGDVVTIGTQDITTQDGDTLKQIVKSATAYDTKLIGVASDPLGASDFNSVGYNIDEDDRPYPVALVGRVKVKISENSEDILPGDLLTSSTEPGRAMKATQPGQTIGKALQAWSSSNPTDTVMMFVTTSYADANNSSQRYKTHVDGLSYGLSDLMKLRPVSFDWKSTGASDIGFIAEEVNKVNPNLVYKNSKGQVEGVNYKMISILLTKAVQEQQLQIENLSNMVAINMAIARADELTGQVRVIDSEVEGNFTVSGQVNLGRDSVGRAVILAGSRQVRINFSQSYSYPPIVTATPTGNNALASDFRYSITGSDADGFSIELDGLAENDTTFNWHAFAGQGARVFVSDGSSHEVTFSVDDSPEPVNIIVPESGPASEGETPEGDQGDQTGEGQPEEGGEIIIIEADQPAPEEGTEPDAGDSGETSSEEGEPAQPDDGGEQPTDDPGQGGGEGEAL